MFAVIAWSALQTYREQIRELEGEALAMAKTVVVYLDRGLDLKAIQTVIADIPLPASSVVTITDDDSTVLARSVDPAQYVGQRVDASPLPLAQVPQFVQRVGVDGVTRVFANAVFGSGPWLVSVGIPSSMAMARVFPIYRRIVILALLVSAFTVLLEFLLLRSYTTAFDRAVVFANRVSSGDLTAPIPSRMPSREMERMQYSAIEMVHKMREAQESIAWQVTEERRMRQELESLQRQVIRQERLAAIGVLVSGVAHELNNPLQAVLGFAELLQMRDDLPAAARHELALIQKESARASAIIRNLSRFSRQQTADPTVVRLRDVVASVVELRQRRLDEGSIELKVTQTGDPSVLAVFAELQQVVLNFVINAEQAVVQSPQPHIIHITVAQHDHHAHLEVADTGPGVPPEDEPKLFQPFFTTKPVGEGTGLGLSVSYGIIQSHGGSIGYRRGLKGGAVFFFALPEIASVSLRA